MFGSTTKTFHKDFTVKRDDVIDNLFITSSIATNNVQYAFLNEQLQKIFMPFNGTLELKVLGDNIFTFNIYNQFITKNSSVTAITDTGIKPLGINFFRSGNITISFENALPLNTIIYINIS